MSQSECGTSESNGEMAAPETGRGGRKSAGAAWKDGGAGSVFGLMKGRYSLLIVGLIVVLILPVHQWVTRGRTDWGYVTVVVPLVVLVWLAKYGAPLLTGWWLKWYVSQGQVVIARLKAVKPTMLGERKLTVVWQEYRRDGSVQEIEDELKVFFLGMECYEAGDWLRLWLRPGRARSWRLVDQLLMSARVAEMRVPACLEAEGVTCVPFQGRR